ncbi:hypothetical protein [Mucilaginibacter sp. dw_454]|uniref:hypothetical protein n=1 Tax=Mucilaginibacter sp. dw_454 TaxID=2720079 RepID=UPI001BD623E2|nr:hypothetical protein [Mucilaginibacter sp. dw_454]
MKIKLLIVALMLSCLFVNASIAQQNKKFYPWMFDQTKDFDLVYKNKKVEVEINNNNIRKIFGKPLKTLTAKSEITEHMYTDYYYPFAVFTIEDNSVTHIDFKGSNLSYIFKLKGKFSKPINIGSSAVYVRDIFPNSWRNMKENFVVVDIKGTDCSILFEIGGSYIKSISFDFNES